jgi:hypothetical protein
MTDRARLTAWLGPPGSTLRRWRILLCGALVVLLAWLVGPYRPWALPGDPSLIPKPGQSRIHVILVASWYAALVNAFLVAALLAVSRFWARDEAEPLAATAPRTARIAPGVFALLLLACALAGALRWPLAHKGVWWDEAWTVRNTIVGKLDPAKEDRSRLEFVPATWSKTLWYYHKPTNHALYSIAAKLSIDTWRIATGGDREAWSEFALRFPAFAAAIATVLLLGVFVHQLGFARAAPAAAFLLAIHPWHVRFGADGRGYSFMVLFAAIAALCLLHALRDGRWRWFLGYGAAQLGLLWVHPLAVHFPIAMATAGLAGTLLGPGTLADRRVRAGRFVVANVLAGIAFLQAMAPNLAQTMLLGHEWRELPSAWVTIGRSLWGLLATGVPLRMVWDPDYSFPSLYNLWGGGFFVKAIVFGLIPALLAVGLVRAVRRGGAVRIVALGLFAAVPLVTLHRALHGFLLIERFALYGLVASVPFVVLGIEGVLQAALPERARRAGVPVGLALALVAFQLFVWPQTRLLLERPQMPSREIAAFLAEKDVGVPGGVIRAGVALGGNVPEVYDHAIVHVQKREQLEELARRSREEGRPFYIFYGYSHSNRVGPFRAVFIDLDDADAFREVASWSGIESDFVFRMFEYTGAPVPKR